jgi:hypothetical protein
MKTLYVNGNEMFSVIEDDDSHLYLDVVMGKEFYTLRVKLLAEEIKLFNHENYSITILAHEIRQKQEIFSDRSLILP